MYITKISPEVNDKIIAIKIFASPGSVDRNIVSFFANDELKFTSPGYNIFYNSIKYHNRNHRKWSFIE